MAESLAADSCVLRMGHIDSPDEFLAFELASSSHASSRGFALSRFCRGLGGLSSEAYPNMQMQGKGKKSTRFTFFAYVAVMIISGAAWFVLGTVAYLGMVTGGMGCGMLSSSIWARSK